MLTEKQADKNKSDLENKHTKSEIANNYWTIIISGLSLVFTILLASWNWFQEAKITELEGDLQTMTLVESMIDDLTGSSESREIALSALYGVLILEKKEQNKLPKYSLMMVEIADSILESSYRKGNKYERSKALSIIGELDPQKHKEWVDKNSGKNPEDVREILNMGEKKGLVYIQYNDKSKNNKIETLRDNLSQENWNAPGTELITNNFPNKSELRYFNKEDKELAEQLKAQTEGILECRDCLTLRNLSSQYPNVQQGQLELWITSNSISN